MEFEGDFCKEFKNRIISVYEPGRNHISRNLVMVCVMELSTKHCNKDLMQSIVAPTLMLIILFCIQWLPIPLKLNRKYLESLAVQTIQIEAM